MNKLIILFAACATISAAHAQRTGIDPIPASPRMQPAPIIQMPITTPMPSASPSIPSTSLAPAATAPTAALPSAAAPQNVSPCQRPQDCPDRSAEQEARRRFTECVAKSRMSPDALNTKTLEDCVLGFMSPNKFTAFKQCLSRHGSAWGCYQQAYR